VPDRYWLDDDIEMSALEQARQRRVAYQQLAGTFTGEQAARASALLRRHPNLSAGLMQALAQAPQPEEIEQRLIEQDDGGIFDRIRDFGGDALGDVVDGVTGGAEWLLDQTYEKAIKPAIRGTFLIADTLAQEVVQRPLTSVLAMASGEGNLRENYNRYGDSALVNALQGDVDETAEGGLFGTGFFAGGQAGAESRNERTLQIRGRRADVGQAIAGATIGQFVDPGEGAYDLVAGISGFAVDVGLDPLAWLTGGASKAVTAARTLKAGDAADIMRAAGAIQGARRNTVLVEQASDFFRSKDLLSKLAEADAYTIAKSWRQSKANRLDGDMIRRLGAASTEEEVAAHLLDAVAHGDVTQAGLLRGKGFFVKSNPLTTRGPLKFLGPNGKLSGLAPTGVVSAGSADELWESAEKMDSLLRQANVDEGFRRVIYNQMVDLDEGDFAGLFDITTDALDHVGRQLGDGDLASLKDVAAKYRDELEAFREYGVDSWGDPIDVPFADRKLVQNFDGQTVETIIPTPQMTSELNSLSLALPDVTDIRRAATKNALLRKVYTSKGWEVTADATRTITRDLFKPLAILRPAYVVRIGAEEQARLAAAHYDSIYNHPFRWLMANVVNRDELKSLSGDNLEDVARVSDVIAKEGTARLADKVASRGRVFSVTSVKLNDDGFLLNDSYRGWRGELGQIAAADEGRKMAELRGNLTEFKDWAMTEGRGSIERLARVNDEAASLLDFGSDFDSWAAGLARRVEAKTAGFDEDIIQRIVDRSIPWEGARSKQGRNADAAFHAFLSGKARSGINPARVKVEHMADARIKMMDRAVDTLFDVLTARPTSRLARFPAFRQSMIRRGEELMDGLANDGLRREALEAFSKNMRLTDDEFSRLAQAAQNAAGSKGVIETVADLDSIIVTKAAQDAKDLLFDVTKRGAAQDALVAVVPFLDAWKEVTLNWSRLLKENPAFFIRAQAGYQEMREQGRFYVNEYGQEVFRYPGGGFLSTFVDEMNQRGGGLQNVPMAGVETVGRVLTGDTPDFSVAPEAPLQGLNLIATGVGPGFGPVVQWAATAFGTPDTQRLREFIAPFGTGANDDPEDLLNFGGVVGSLAPAWFRKVANAITEGGIDERQWNSTVGDAMRALVASGEYDPGADSDRLLEDAERYAHYLLLFRGTAQFAGPTGPNMSGEVKIEGADTENADWDPENDPTGKWFALSTLRNDYFRLEETYGGDVAAEKFYDLYGLEPFYVVQGKTTSQGRELPVTEEGQRWMEANRDVVDQFPLIAGFFAPTAEADDFDFSVFSTQVLAGERKSLTPKEQQALANKARARAIWARVQSQTEMLPSALRDSARAQARGQLDALHPGWQMDVILQPSGGDKIMQVERLVREAPEALDDNPLTQPLREYMALRARSLDLLRRRTGSPTATLGRSDAALERRQLMTAGLRLAQQNPAFMSIWSGLLKNELSED